MAEARRPLAIGPATDALVSRATGRGRLALIAAVSNGGEHHYSAFGPPSAVPDGDALFEIGSITKAFTGTLLADMHERREVDLRDPVSRWLDPAELPAWPGREPTLIDLATHRAGLPNAPRAMARRELAFSIGLLRSDPWAAVTEVEYRRAVAAIRPKPAGRRLRYSSVGFGLLGDALAAATEKPYEQLLRERVCRPLGLNRAWIDVPARERPTLLTGHTPRGRPQPPLEDLMPGAGSLRSSAAEMLRLLDATMDPPAGPAGRALALAQTPQADGRGRMSTGLGWLLLDRRRRSRVVWHNGGTWGFRSFAAAVPQRRVAVVVLSNTARSVDRLGFALVEKLSG